MEFFCSFYLEIFSSKGCNDYMDQPQLASVGEDQSQADQDVHDGADQQTIAVSGARGLEGIEEDRSKTHVKKTSNDPLAYADHFHLSAERILEVVPSAGHSVVDKENIEDSHENSTDDLSGPSSFNKNFARIL